LDPGGVNAELKHSPSDEGDGKTEE